MQFVFFCDGNQLETGNLFEAQRIARQRCAQKLEVFNPSNRKTSSLAF